MHEGCTGLILQRAIMQIWSFAEARVMAEAEQIVPACGTLGPCAGSGGAAAGSCIQRAPRCNADTGPGV